MLPKNFDPYDFSKKVIHGVPVNYKNLPWAPCIHIRIVFPVGAFTDPIGKEGVSHFLEHLVGAGSPMLPDKKAVKEFDRMFMLDSRNASTSHSWVAYTGKCLPENFSTVITHLLDLIFKPHLKFEDMEAESKIIMQEAWGVYKNEKLLKYIQDVTQNIYHGHQRERITSPLGWPKSIVGIEHNDLLSFHKENYVRENMRLFLVGAVSQTELEIIPPLLLEIPKGSKALTDEGTISKPLSNRIEKTAEEIGETREQLELSISRSIPKLTKFEQDTGYHVNSLLSDVLFERLRTEHSLCYGVNVRWDNHKSFSEIGISVDTSEDKLELVEKEIASVIKEIIDGKWKDRFKTLHKVKIDRIKSNERLSGDIIYSGAQEIIFDGRIETLEEMIASYEKVTYANVVRFLQKMFDPEFTFTQVIFPNKK